MGPGDVLDGRYLLESVAGEGGMGLVYHARDQQTGEGVALKYLKGSTRETSSRFTHEARFLSELQHPHIVRYLSHAVAPSGDPYLVMEWLEGESLEHRLARGRLDDGETLLIARSMAAALAAAHAQGIIHRDVKPSNVFLVEARADRVKLLDFGIARITGEMIPITRTGCVIGTPGYMSPEQASGERAQVGPQSDVFSLGCVLFECLLGRPAFSGGHVMALLAKLLLEEPPRVREIRPELPEALSALVARMLSKDADKRPADGAAVLAALEGIALSDDPLPVSSLRTGAVSTHEKRLVAVIALQPPAVGPTDETRPMDKTLARGVMVARVSGAPFGARVEELANGMIVCLLVGSGPATDQAADAARCALQMRRALPELPMVLLMGRSESTGRSPIGEVLERAALMLEQALTRDRPASRPGAPIAIDAVTQALLDVRFEVREEGGRLLLCGEQEIGDHARPLLGKPAPFLGRERELHNLLGLIEESFEERSPCALLVTAAAGIGKSRLRQELVEALHRRGPEVSISIGRGDAMGAGSTFALLGSAARGKLGISIGEPLELRRSKLLAEMEAALPEADRRRVAELVGEMIGTPFPDEDSPRLRAARQSEALMARQIEAAYLDWIRALSSRRPVLLVLEDLHWGDEASVKLLDAALRDLTDAPFVVLAFARPEVQSLFPRLWASRELHHVRLRELPRKAAESLVRAVLGATIDAAGVEALVDRAAGNAFYLEELIRAVAEGRAGALPDTVLGMVEARLRALMPNARRVLRAASLLGEVFWKSAVLALLGEDAAGLHEEDPFSTLCNLELIVRRGKPRFAGEEEYGFRHALLREGAYAMLPAHDREVGHRRAGEWLEAAGEQDLLILAEHFHRGGEHRRAIALYLHAGKNARAAAVSCEALRAFGIVWPEGEDERRAALDEAMARQADDMLARPPASRIDAPTMSNPTALAAEQLLMTAALPAYFTSASLYGLMMCAWLDLLHREGHSEISAMGYVFHGAFLMSLPGRAEDAHAFGLLGTALLERRPNPALTCRVVETVAGNIAFLHEPIRALLARFPPALLAGVEAGDWLHAAYICGHLTAMRLFIGDDLAAVAAQMEDNAPILRRSRDLFMEAALHVFRGAVRALGGPAPAGSPGPGEEPWSEEAIRALGDQEDFATFGGLHHTIRLLSSAVLGDWAQARIEAEAAEAKGPHAPGQFFATQLAFLGALARIRTCPPGELEADRQLAAHRDDLLRWALSCPATFRAGHLLVEAEHARARGEDAAASALYEASLHAAREGGLTRDEALAAERYAAFLAARGDEAEARAQREAARGAYGRWGARVKVALLESARPPAA